MVVQWWDKNPLSNPPKYKRFFSFSFRSLYTFLLFLALALFLSSISSWIDNSSNNGSVSTTTGWQRVGIKARFTTIYISHEHLIWHQDIQCAVQVPDLFTLAGFDFIHHLMGIHLRCDVICVDQQPKPFIMLSLRNGLRHFLFSNQDHYLWMVR